MQFARHGRQGVGTKVSTQEIDAYPLHRHNNKNQKFLFIEVPSFSFNIVLEHCRLSSDWLTEGNLHTTFILFQNDRARDCRSIRTLNQKRSWKDDVKS